MVVEVITSMPAAAITTLGSAAPTLQPLANPLEPQFPLYLMGHQ